MTREEKFEARLRELGLTREWENQGRFGKVATTDKYGKIALLVHESASDMYSEIHYPSLAELRTEYYFVKNCILEWKGYDKDFETALDAWFSDPVGLKPCPLVPVDVYFPGEMFQTSYHDFEDDQEDTDGIETIQEFTLRAQELGMFDILFNERDMSRPDILALIKEWAEEFHANEEVRHGAEPDWFYYDEVDEFLHNKFDNLK